MVSLSDLIMQSAFNDDCRNSVSDHRVSTLFSVDIDGAHGCSVRVSHVHCQC